MKTYNYLRLLVIIILFGFSFNATGQVRNEIPFNAQWNFQIESITGLEVDELVNLPHTWNARDAQEGIKYLRSTGHYSKRFVADKSWSGKRVFIRFEGANISSSTKINGQQLGEHKGGYAAFCYELTDHLMFDQENLIEVDVSNEENLEVIPLVGDFNNYGGIYRPVSLLILNPVCITPLDYASPGIYITQKNVSERSAEVEVLTKVSNSSDQNVKIDYRVSILNDAREVLDSKIGAYDIGVGEMEIVQAFTIDEPHLWNGKKDPYLYSVQVEILHDGQVIDTKSEPMGLRYFRVDANEGFFLNGEPMDLRGVSRHQDRKDKGSAISDADHRQDMDMMLEMGINALRLAHYQHAELIYDLTDSAGVVVWAELPWVGGPSGFMGNSNGYENTEAFHEIARQQLYELIRQNYNHPSILMWSIYNEIQNPEGAEPIDFIRELEAIVKQEDPGRLSVAASMLNPQDHPDMHQVTDLIAFNRYFGWYYKEPKDMGVFLDKLHQDFPDLKIGISEYGAGGSIHQHSDKLVPPNPMGSPHPEEWQSYYHEENLKIFDDRPFVWGTFVWNMFDFGSHFRKEGDHYGINDKGMVSYDRKTKKDAFYFYKANWSDQPVLHITSSRYVFRKKANTDVKVYTNLDDVTLMVNGEKISAESPDKGIIIWEDILLEQGNNSIVVTAEKDGKTYTSDCLWVFENPYAGMNLVIKLFNFMTIAYKVALGGFILAFMLWFFGIRKAKRHQKFRKFVLWTVVVLVSLASTAIALGKFAMSNMLGS